LHNVFSLLQVFWLYTPSTSTSRTGNNVDLGRQALIETANMTYGGALFIFVTILFLRAITNVVIPHPYNREGLPSFFLLSPPSPRGC